MNTMVYLMPQNSDSSCNHKWLDHAQPKWTMADVVPSGECGRTALVSWWKQLELLLQWLRLTASSSEHFQRASRLPLHPLESLEKWFHLIPNTLFAIRQLQEKYSGKKTLYCAFIDFQRLTIESQGRRRSMEWGPKESLRNVRIVEEGKN